MITPRLSSLQAMHNAAPLRQCGARSRMTSLSQGYTVHIPETCHLASDQDRPPHAETRLARESNAEPSKILTPMLPPYAIFDPAQKLSLVALAACLLGWLVGWRTGGWAGGSGGRWLCCVVLRSPLAAARCRILRGCVLVQVHHQHFIDSS